MVAKDVLDGKVSLDRARTIYQVVVDDETTQLDWPATARLRESKQNEFEIEE